MTEGRFRKKNSKKGARTHLKTVPDFFAQGKKTVETTAGLAGGLSPTEDPPKDEYT